MTAPESAERHLTDRSAARPEAGAASDRPPLIALVGPTAVGKTALSLDLAERFGCEIISGDSMQVYRRMDIGTAKIPPGERRGIPHHLIDIREPHEPFTVAEFQRLCAETIRDIVARGRIPLLVGGSGLYIEAVCYGFPLTEFAGDPDFRRRMQDFAAEQGPEALHRRLRDVDPDTAARLHPHDVRRIIRALEIYEATGKPMSEVQGQRRGEPKTSPYNLALVGLTMDREQLYARIDRRVDEMLANGLVREVADLLAAGVPRDATSMQAIGYKEIAAYLAGETDYGTAVATLKRNTRLYAKRQLSWFRRMPDLVWMDVTEKKGNIFPNICDIITKKVFNLP